MLKRVIVYILGILIVGFGVILNTKTGLGVAAINSVPYSLSQMSNLTLGNWTTLMYFIFVAIQLIIYRKMDIKVILQIPFSYVMGELLDFYDHLITFVPNSIFESLVILTFAILLTALGVYLIVGMDFIPNPPDGMVKALSYLLKKDFGQVKMMFDCFMMMVTVVMTLVMMGRVVGIGLGTIVSALLVGRCIQFYTKIFNKHIEKIYHK